MNHWLGKDHTRRRLVRMNSDGFVDLSTEDDIERFAPPIEDTVHISFYRQLDFSSEPGVPNEILENEPKSC